jgi:hypothetical protein
MNNKTSNSLRSRHLTRAESNDSKLCKMHIKVITAGHISRSSMNAYNDLFDQQHLSDTQRNTAYVVDDYIDKYGLPSSDKSRLTHYQEKILLAFCEFIDNPTYCHGGRLAGLFNCKSVLKPLQFRQRVTLVKVVTALFSCMNIETGTIGSYSNKSRTAVFDESGRELFQPITHADIRDKFKFIWNESISKTRYYDSLKMLKLAKMIEIDACFLCYEDGVLLRNELRENGASLEEIEAIPRVHSLAAYKFFTPKFFSVFSELLQSQHMILSLQRAKKKNKKLNRSNSYTDYAAFSDSFFTKKRKDYLSLISLKKGNHIVHRYRQQHDSPSAHPTH